MAVTRRRRGVFGIFLAHRNWICVAQLSNTLHFRWFGLLRSQFAIYWMFGGLGDREIFRPPPGPETGQKRPKGGFSWSWGAFWAKRPPAKFDWLVNADPVTLFGVPCVPGVRDTGALGGAGGRFVSWGPVSSVRGPTGKNNSNQKKCCFQLRFQRAYFCRILAPGAPYRSRAH